MQWDKVKRVLIGMLALTVCILLGQYELRVLAERRVTDGARRDVLALLAERGLTVDAALLTEERIAPLEIPRDKAGERAVALLLLGLPEEQDLGGEITQYDAPGIGSARFRSAGLFDVLLEQPGVLPEFWPGPETCQHVAGRPVFNAVVTAETTREIHGRWLWGEPLLSDSQTSRPAGEILLGLTQQTSAREVYAMELGYLADRAPLPGSAILTPVWKITCDAGVLYVNGLTGVLESA